MEQKTNKVLRVAQKCFALFFVTQLFFVSCNVLHIEKRKYTKGFYVCRKKQPKETKLNEKDFVNQDQGQDTLQCTVAAGDYKQEPFQNEASKIDSLPIACRVTNSLVMFRESFQEAGIAVRSIMRTTVAIEFTGLKSIKHGLKELILEIPGFTMQKKEDKRVRSIGSIIGLSILGIFITAFVMLIVMGISVKLSDGNEAVGAIFFCIAFPLVLYGAVLAYCHLYKRKKHRFSSEEERDKHLKWLALWICLGMALFALAIALILIF